MTAYQLNGATSVQPTLGLKVGGVGFFGGFEVAEKDMPTINPNSGTPGVLNPTDASEPAGIVARHTPSVVLVQRGGNIAEIRHSVVGPYAVDVVNLPNRPLSGGVEPSNSMYGVNLELEPNLQVAVAVERAGSIACVYSDAWLDAPVHEASVGVVREKLPRKRGGKMDLSHEALQLLIGQRPAGVASAALASSFCAVWASSHKGCTA